MSFDGDTTVAIAIKHLQEEMVPPSVYSPDLPYSLEQIIMKCTQKSVDRRYNKMEDVIEDLKHSLIDPQGDFVKLTSVDTDAKTVVISDEELGEIKHTPKQTLKPDIETLEKELNETNYDDDDDFEYDNKEESSKGSRKNRDRERSREREERERRIKKQKKRRQCSWKYYCFDHRCRSSDRGNSCCGKGSRSDRRQQGFFFGSAESAGTGYPGC